MKEIDVEKSAVAWLCELGYEHIRGPELAPGGASPERASYGDVVLEDRLRAALARINRHLDANTLDIVTRDLLRTNHPSLEENNAEFHHRLIAGYRLELRGEDGSTRGDFAHLIDLENPGANDWLVTDQLTVRQGRHEHRPDLVVYLNGLPIAVLELKNPEAENATLLHAWRQLQTYKRNIPVLFHHNQLLVASDGIRCRLGSLTAGFERFGPWRTLDGESRAPATMPELEVLLRGLFEKEKLLEYLRHFILWETDGATSGDFSKKIAGYHQFHAARKAVRETVRASRLQGDRRIGVIWHTQGSGKSLSMVFYAGQLVVHPAMENPTLVVVTDRNDLDGQLLGQFAKAEDLLRGAPTQAESRDHLRELLRVPSGGVVFTTMQKWSLDEAERSTGAQFPVLSERRNIVVIADEAHRTQYGMGAKVDPKTGKINIGFARNLRDGLPNASFVAFTGTPIELADRSTPAVFGDLIDTYSIRQSVTDNATVPLHYEARLARVRLPEEAGELLDEGFEEITEDQEERVKDRLKSRWARLEAMVGAPERIALVARDILDHWQKRTEILEGKAMIVGMSRRIAVELYAEILRLRPEWEGTGEDDGVIKVVMHTQSSDDPAFCEHRRTRKELQRLENRFKDPEDPLQIVIVRDMWLTGFNAPCAHTLYVDKPMRGHGLMQAIARVNRVFRDKPAGLVVDYIGLADSLGKAVRHYGGEGRERPAAPVDEALHALEQTFGVVRDMFHGFDTGPYFGDDPAARLGLLAAAVDHVLGLENGRRRFLDAMAALEKAAAIALHLDEARGKRDLIGFFQGVRANLRKYTLDPGDEGGYGEATKGGDLQAMNAAIRQIVAGAVATEGVVDIFATAGLDKPDLSILSDEFFEALQRHEHPNLQLAVLQKLLAGEIKALSRTNVVQARRFSEMLRRTLFAYQNRTLESAQIILQLIEMAKELRGAPDRAKTLGITADELAFYDALADHGNVREVMGDSELAEIAHDLVEAIRRSVTLDWTQKEAVRADLRRKVKRLLRKHGYPPDKQEAAVATVIEQAETLCRNWAELPLEERGRPRRAETEVERTFGGESPPFQVLSPESVRPFGNSVPLIALELAAGTFSGPQVSEEGLEPMEWVVPVSRHPPGPRLFVARVVGESMNRKIPNGAWCLWRANPTGSRDGRVVLAEHRSIDDPETGGSYTVKRYHSEKTEAGDGSWRHSRIELRPDSDDPTFAPLVFDAEAVQELRVVAELVEVLEVGPAVKPWDEANLEAPL